MVKRRSLYINEAKVKRLEDGGILPYESSSKVKLYPKTISLGSVIDTTINRSHSPRLKEGSFVDPEKAKSIHIGTERIKLSEKDEQIMNRYCYDLSSYIVEDESETMTKKSKGKVLIHKLIGKVTNHE